MMRIINLVGRDVRVQTIGHCEVDREIMRQARRKTANSFYIVVTAAMSMQFYALQALLHSKTMAGILYVNVWQQPPPPTNNNTSSMRDERSQS